MAKLIPHTPDLNHIIDFDTYDSYEDTATCSVCGPEVQLVKPRWAKPGGPGYRYTDLICRYSLPSPIVRGT